MKHYFHGVVVPIVGVLSAHKTISQNSKQFYLNESFASWLTMLVFAGFSSTQNWYRVCLINSACFVAYYFIVLRTYGVSGIGNDFYVHITTTAIFTAVLIRKNELNLRSSFGLLSQAKIS